MSKKAFSCVVLVAALIGLSKSANAQSSIYEGKVMRILVGGGAGGGFDTYSRAIARHLGKHVPGNPTVIVENMPGGGSLIAANYVSKVAKPDGLTIGNFIGTLLLRQILGGPGIEFDARRFEYLGVPVKVGYVCAFTTTSGITSLEKWMATKPAPKIGSTGPGTGLNDVAKILEASLGLPVRLISGYKSIADIRLAAEGGEVDGICGVGWETLKATWTKLIQAGNVAVVLQTRPKPHPELPNVPLAIDFAKTEEARELIRVVAHDGGAFLQVYVLPPGTPNDRVVVLRRAFQNTMTDPEFLAEAKKSRLDIDPSSGEEIEGIVSGLFKLSPQIVSRLKEVLK